MQGLTSKLNKIIDALSDDEIAKRTIPRYMDTLTRRVKECEDSLEKMEAKFKNWLEIAQELSQVATDSERKHTTTMIFRKTLTRQMILAVRKLRVMREFSHKRLGKNLQKKKGRDEKKQSRRQKDE